MTDFQLGPPMRCEAGRIGGMSRTLVEHGLAWRWRPARIARLMENADYEVVVARDRGRVIGFCVAEFGDSDVHICLLAVAPSHRRRGVGRRLVDWICKMAHTAMASSIRLEVRKSNPGARRFYERAGFRATSVILGYYEGVEDAVRMSYRVRDARRA